MGFIPMYYGFCVSKNVWLEWGSSSIVWAKTGRMQKILSAGLNLGGWIEDFLEGLQFFYYAYGYIIERADNIMLDSV